MNKLKGVTPVVATTLLIGITIAAAGSVYVYTQNIIDKSADTKEKPFSVSKVSFETCYKKNNKVHISLRNSNNYAFNTSRINFYINAKIVKESNYDTQPNIAKARSTFQIITTKTITTSSQLKVTGPQDSKKFRCLSLATPQPVPVTTTPLKASFTYTPTTPQKGEQVNFQDTSQGNQITSYQWDFTNDGSYDATGPTTTHTYNSVGTFTVKLKITNSTGATSTATQNIDVQ
ncbi:MAG: PKD domain-containing protein [Candidatus Nanohaloarchaea archaeon]